MQHLASSSPLWKFSSIFLQPMKEILTVLLFVFCLKSVFLYLNVYYFQHFDNYVSSCSLYKDFTFCKVLIRLELIVSLFKSNLVKTLT